MHVGSKETAVVIVASATTMSFLLLTCKDCINIKYETNEEIKVNIAFDVPDIE